MPDRIEIILAAKNAEHRRHRRKPAPKDIGSRRRQNDPLPRRLRKGGIRYVNFYDLGMINLAGGAFGESGAPTFNVTTVDPTGGDKIRAYANHPLGYPESTWKSRYRKITPASTESLYRLAFVTNEGGFDSPLYNSANEKRLDPADPNWTNRGYIYNHRIPGPSDPPETYDPLNAGIYIRGGWDVKNASRLKKIYESGAWPGSGVADDPSFNVDMFENTGGSTFGFDSREHFVTRPDGSFVQWVDDGTDVDFFLNPTVYGVAGVGTNRTATIQRGPLIAVQGTLTNSTAAAITAWGSLLGTPGIYQFNSGGSYFGVGGLGGAIHQSGRWYFVPGI